MKCTIFGIFILSAFFIATTQFVYAGKSWEYKDWSVSSYTDFVRYVAHGDTVDGHQFGFINNSDNCDRNILWISLSTQNHDLQDLKGLEGVNATIQIKIDETQFQANVDVLAVSKVTPSLAGIAFTNFLAGEKFIAVLERGKEVEVTILAPEALLNRLDITTDTFSLQGFTATMLKAKEYCESNKTGPSTDQVNSHSAISTKTGQGETEASQGKGVTEDYAQTIRSYQKAAEQGNDEAQLRLGWIYHKGVGVNKDYAQAFKWYEKAAEQGEAKAQTLLGSMYSQGEGVNKDYVQAIKWYQKAAKQGNAEAQVLLGTAYAYGDGVTKDYAQAVKWYQKAAEPGNVVAQFVLGFAYLSGKGVPQDKIKAYEWYMKSARQGNIKAQDALDILCKESPWACK